MMYINYFWCFKLLMTGNEVLQVVSNSGVKKYALPSWMCEDEKQRYQPLNNCGKKKTENELLVSMMSIKICSKEQSTSLNPAPHPKIPVPE